MNDDDDDNDDNNIFFFWMILVVVNDGIVGKASTPKIKGVELLWFPFVSGVVIISMIVCFTMLIVISSEELKPYTPEMEECSVSPMADWEDNTSDVKL